MTLHELQRRLTGFDIREQVIDTIAQTQPDIVKLNQGQLFIGILSDGTPITNIQKNRTTYGPFWGVVRERLGLQIDHYDLKVSGEYWDSIQVDSITDKTFTIDAKSAKQANITSMFGEKVLGLTDQSKDEEYIPNYFFPVLKERIQGRLGLNFS